MLLVGEQRGYHEPHCPLRSVIEYGYEYRWGEVVIDLGYYDPEYGYVLGPTLKYWGWGYNYGPTGSHNEVTCKEY